MQLIKTLPLILISLFLVSCTTEEVGKYDNRAIAALDLMSDTIGELKSCSYTLNAIRGSQDGVEHTTEHDVYMRGPDKMYIHTHSSEGQKSLWYDGKKIARYSFEDNTYATIDAPDNIIKTIDYVNDKYGIDFPAADFFYPNFTDDVLAHFDQLLFVGDEMVDGKEVTSVFASNEEQNVQIWIEKATNLPLKMLMESKTSATEFYLATFSNFRVNPNLPDALFAINPPVNSAEAELKPIK